MGDLNSTYYRVPLPYVSLFPHVISISSSVFAQITHVAWQCNSYRTGLVTEKVAGQVPAIALSDNK